MKMKIKKSYLQDTPQGPLSDKEVRNNNTAHYTDKRHANTHLVSLTLEKQTELGKISYG